MIYKKKCPICKKEISSLSEQQFNYNYEQHINSHKRQEECKKNATTNK